MDRDANDITAMMPKPELSMPKGGKSPKLIWVVLACVVMGVVGGIVVYQQSIKTKTTVKTTPKPVASKPPTVAVKPSPALLISPTPNASGSAQPAGINLVDDWENDDTEIDDPDLPGSPSPSASSSLIASASTSPSPSVKASSTTSTKTATPSSSTRVTMPDTTDGVPVTGIFEITAGTIGAGVFLIILGALGLLLL